MLYEKAEDTWVTFNMTNSALQPPIYSLCCTERKVRKAFTKLHPI